MSLPVYMYYTPFSAQQPRFGGHIIFINHLSVQTVFSLMPGLEISTSEPI